MSVQIAMTMLIITAVKPVCLGTGSQFSCYGQLAGWSDQERNYMHS